MDNTTKDVFDAIENLDSLTDKMEDTEWIILDRPVRTALKTTRVMRKGMMVRIARLAKWHFLSNVTDGLGPTHVIIALRNNITNTAFELDCEEIGTENTITVKL